MDFDISDAIVVMAVAIVLVKCDQQTKKHEIDLKQIEIELEEKTDDQE